jgi:hypothetical protein
MATGQRKTAAPRRRRVSQSRCRAALVRLAFALVGLRPGQRLRAGTGVDRVLPVLRHSARIVRLTTLVVLALIMLALVMLVVLALLRVLLAAMHMLLPALVVGVDHAVIVLGMLVVVLGRDAITGGSRITRHRQVFLQNLIGIAANPYFRSAAVEGLRPAIGHMGLIAAIVAAALALHVHGASISFTSGIAGFLVEPGGARRFHQHDTRFTAESISLPMAEDNLQGPTPALQIGFR